MLDDAQKRMKLVAEINVNEAALIEAQARIDRAGEVFDQTDQELCRLDELYCQLLDGFHETTEPVVRLNLMERINTCLSDRDVTSTTRYHKAKTELGTARTELQRLLEIRGALAKRFDQLLPSRGGFAKPRESAGLSLKTMELHDTLEINR